jgi:Mrp family chromosome partitioning ATPase
MAVVMQGFITDVLVASKQRRRRRQQQQQRTQGQTCYLLPLQLKRVTAPTTPASTDRRLFANPGRFNPSSTPMSSGRSTPFSGARPALANAFVSISGLIGAGKSTLAVALGKELSLPVHFEPVAENVYLQDFYRDMKT